MRKQTLQFLGIHGINLGLFEQRRFGLNWLCPDHVSVHTGWDWELWCLAKYFSSLSCKNGGMKAMPETKRLARHVWHWPRLWYPRGRGRSVERRVPESICSSAHSEHRFPAPFSKLCQSWLRHWRGTLYLRSAVHRRGQRPPKGSGTNHTPSTAFRHLPPNSARFSYATEGALYLRAAV